VPGAAMKLCCIGDDIGRYIKKLVRGLSRPFRTVFSPNYRYIRFAEPGSYYSPIPDIGIIRRNKVKMGDSVREVLSSIDLNENGQIGLARIFAGNYPGLMFGRLKSKTGRYYYENDFFSYGDAVVLYSMLREFRPTRVLEIGSGFSSAAMLDVDDQYFGGNTEFIFVEPYPERLRGLLHDADKDRCRILECPVEEADLSMFSRLEENDILFVDSSHVGKSGSDVLHILFRVLPMLKRGVIVHFHDILWPFEYPIEWLEQGRAWNEAYLVRAFLQFNNSYEIMFFNSYMERIHPDLLRECLPAMLEVPASRMTPGNSSLWIRKIA
jgi:hypothetical protein